MNSVFRLVWNRSLGRLVVASEAARSHRKAGAGHQVGQVAEPVTIQSPIKYSLRPVTLSIIFAFAAMLSPLGSPDAEARKFASDGGSCTSGAAGSSVGRIATPNTSADPVDGSGTYSLVAGCDASGNNQLAATVYGAFSQVTGKGGAALGFNTSAAQWATAIGVEARATGNSAIALGFGGQATQLNAIAIGSAGGNGTTPLSLANSTTASGQHSIAIGSNNVRGAQATDLNAIAIGGEASANTQSSVAIGQGANVSGGGVGGVAVGSLAVASTSISTALGAGAQAQGDNSISIGANRGTPSVASADGAQAIGNLTNASGVASMAYGRESIASGSGAIAMGQSAQANADGAVAIGGSTEGFNGTGAAQANGLLSVALGNQSLAQGDNTLALGVAATASEVDAIAMGTGAEASATNAIAIGKDSTASGVDTGAIGRGAIATGSWAVGTDANASNGGQAFGEFSTASGINSSAYGRFATATGENSSALGTSATAEGDRATAAGFQAKALDDESVAFGVNSVADGANAIAIGSNARTNAGTGDTHSIAIGDSAEAWGQSIALGVQATADQTTNDTDGGGIAIGAKSNVGGGTYAGTAIGIQAGATGGMDVLAIGSRATSSASQAVAIGADASAVTSGGVALGSGAVADTAAGIAGYVPTGATAADAAAIGATAATQAAVDVGSRQITSVAAGTADDDAVNVSQLIASQSSVDAGTNIANVVEGENPDGGTTYTVNANGTSVSAGSGAVDVTAAAPDANNVTDYAVDLSQASKDSLTLADSALQTVVTQIDGSNVKTLDQNDNVANFISGQNIELSDDNGAIEIGTLDNVTFTDVQTSTLTAGPVSIDATGIDAGNTTISNLAPGVAGTDAVNVDQLAVSAAASRTEVAAGTNVASVDQATGADGQDIYTVNASGASVSAGSGAVDVTAAAPDANNVTDYAVDLSQSSKDSLTLADSALQTVVTQIDGTNVKTLDQNDNVANFVTGDNIVLSDDNGAIEIATAQDVTFTTVNSDSLAITGGPTLTGGGIDMNNTSISNLADGVNAQDAVNLSQLQTSAAASRTEVVAGTNVASVGQATGADGQDIYTVNASGASVSAGSGAVDVTAAAPDANNVTDYAVDLSQASKDSLTLADSALQTIVTQIDGTNVKTLDQNDNVANFISGDNIELSDDNGAIEIATSPDLTADSLTINNGPTLNDNGIDMGGDTITNLGDPVNGGDAVNLDYFDENRTHYYSVNDGGVQQDNYNNDGATGTRALAAGVGALAQDDDSVAIGTDALAAGGNSDGGAVAIGRIATANGDGATAIGSETLANADGATAIGDDANALANFSTAIGDGSEVSALSVGGVALGTEANVSGFLGGVAVGPLATVSGTNGAAFGAGSTVTVANGVALGSGSVASTAAGVAGYDPTTDAASTETNSAWLSTSGAVSVGGNGETRQITNIAAGAEDTDAVNVAQLKAGQTHYYSVNDGGTIGGNYNNDGATGLNAIASGIDASASGDGAVALGFGADAPISDSLALGSGSVVDRALAPDSGFIPAGSATIEFNTTDKELLGAISVGDDDSYRQITNVADGTQAQDAVTVRQLQGAVGSVIDSGTKYFRANSTAPDAAAVGNDSIAVGPTTVTNGDNGIGMGNGAIVGQMAPGGTAIGNNAEVMLSDGIAFGTNALSEAQQGIALGAGATVSHDQSVALGSNSSTADAVGTSGVTIAGDSYTFAGTTPDSTVSIGSVGNERTLTNVAAGRVSETSTDAINGSQLFASNQAIEEVSAIANTGWNIQTNNDAATNVAPGDTVQMIDGKNIAITRNGTDITVATIDSPQFGNVTVNTAGGDTINGLSNLNFDPDNFTSGQAASEDQLKQVSDIANTGWNLSAQDAVAQNIAPNDEVNLRNSDGNLVITQATNNSREEMTFNLSDDVVVNNSVSVGSVVTNATTNDIVGLSNIDLADPSFATLGRAATEEQLAISAAASRTEVLAGTNVASVGQATGADGQDIYTVNANGASVSAGSGAVDVTAAAPDANNVTDYAVDLSQASKDSLTLADSALQSVVTQIDGTNVKTLDQNDNVANFISGDNIELSDDNGAIEIATSPDLTADSLTINNGPTINDNGIDMGGDTITNLGDPVNAGDAVNLDYFDANRAHYYSVNDGGIIGGNYNNDGATGLNAIASGVNASASGEDSVALGFGASAPIRGSLALGSGSVVDRALAPDSGFIPAGSATIEFNTTDKELLGAISVGDDDSYRQITNVADGTQAQDAVTVRQLQGAVGSVIDSGTKYFRANSTAPDAAAVGNDSIAVGPTTVTNGDNGIGMGNGAIVGQMAPGGTAIGNNAEVMLSDGIAFGTNALSEAQQGIALGAGATVSHDQSVALGSNSSTADAVGTSGVTIAGDSYTFAGTTPDSTVSIGSVGNERTLTNVAAGRVSETSTDAINGSQLFASNQAIEEVSAIANTGWNIQTNNDAATNVAPGDTVQMIDGQNIAITRNGADITVATIDSPQFGNVTVNTAGGDTINGLSNLNFDPDNFTSGQAASEDQLKQVSDIANTGWNIQANGDIATNVAPDDTVQMLNGKNIEITRNGTDITVATADSVAFDDVTITGGPTLNDNGIDMGGDTITNLGDPVNAGDAVNLDYFDANRAHYYSVNDGGTIGGNYNNDGATGLNAIASGVDASASGEGSVALGFGASAPIRGSLALGSGSVVDRALAPDSGFIPAGAATIEFNTTDKELLGAISVGDDDSYRQITNVADGTQAQDAVTVRQLQGAVGSVIESGTKYFRANSTAPDAAAVGNDSIAIGPTTVTNGDNGIGMGNGAIVGQMAPGGTAIGNNAEVMLSDGIAFGSNALSEAQQGIALGAGATVSHDQSVALGSNSSTADAVGTSGVTIAGDSYTFAGTTPDSTVSVGSVGNERTLTNVAAGRVSETSTDAINGSQLFASNQAIEEVKATANAGWNLSTENGAASNVAPNGEVNLRNTDGNIIISQTSNNGREEVTFDLGDDVAIGNSLTVGQDGPVISDEGITNLSEGDISVESQDAINGSQLYATNQWIEALENSVTNVVGDGSDDYITKNGRGIRYVRTNDSGLAVSDAFAQGEGSTAVGYEAVASADRALAMGYDAIASHQGSVALGEGARTAEAVGTTSVDIAGQTYQFAGASPVATVSVGSVGSERTITNVAAGRITADSTDAINGSQLYAAMDFMGSLDDRLTIVEGDTGGGGADGAVMYDRDDNGDINYDSVTLAGEDGTKLTNVADGDISNDSSDAINGSQLHDTNQNVANNTNSIVDNSQRITNNEGNIADNSQRITTNENSITDINETLGLGLNFGADEGDTVNRQLGDTVAITGDDNITTKTTDDGVQITMNRDLDVDSVTTGNTTVNNDGVSIKDGPSMTVNGIDAGGTTITNVAPGVNEGDAVNVGQMNELGRRFQNEIVNVHGRIDSVERNANAGSASAIAASTVPQAWMPGKSMVGVGAGTYGGESAVSVGISRLSDNGRWVIQGKVTGDSQSNFGAGIGAGWHW
ncbi:YadA-like family protein [Vreelandella venusta]|uniref:YadA-like family protein n=1 Tax=Vreelandella venusta TaxID=44935 RepID=UPI003F66CDD0